MDWFGFGWRACGVKTAARKCFVENHFGGLAMTGLLSRLYFPQFNCYRLAVAFPAFCEPFAHGLR